MKVNGVTLKISYPNPVSTYNLYENEQENFVRVLKGECCN